jgi:peptide/nickel transport system substrate-binding protein
MRPPSRPDTTHRCVSLIGLLTILATACVGGGRSASTSGGARPGRVSPSTSVLIPTPGGSLTVGTESEIEGFDPTKDAWDATGYLYASAVEDPLTAIAADGTVHPYLALSVKPNADSTLWTIALRPGVSFSDGEPLNADAVKMNLDAQRASFLTGKVLKLVTSVDKVDDMTVSVKLSAPWTVFDEQLASETGYVAAPRMLKDPNGFRHPVGTGPFIFKEWVPHNHFTATKNPNYWRKGLPYLDSVEFRPIPDFEARESSLRGGTIDAFHTTDPQTVLDFRDDKSFRAYEQTKGRVEQDFQMINTSKPPLNDIRVRQALAYALDRDRYNQLANLGVPRVADGPFSAGSGLTNAPGYPSFDLQKAKDLVRSYELDKGVTSVSFELGTTDIGKNVTDEQLIAEMWKQAGIDAHVVAVEQGQFILNALQGKYDVYGWRQFGEPDVDADYVWWTSDNAVPDPYYQTALNFARNSDPQIDKDMIDARQTNDPAKRKADYEDVSAQLNKDLPYIWTESAVWDIVTKATVEGVLSPTLPDGTMALALNSGRFSIAQVWRTGG